MEFIVCCLIGYFIGTFNPSFLFGKKKGVDIREKGSGNAGTEMRLSFLWKPKNEMDRLRNNADKEDEEFNDKFML